MSSTRITTLNFWDRLCAVSISSLLLVTSLAASQAFGQIELTPLGDVTLATDALLMPRNAPYGRAINTVSYRSEAITTIGDYQYSSWYNATGSFSENLMLARRDLQTGVIEVMDTGRNFVNGDSSGGDGSSSWDAHNVISLGVSTADGRLHLSYDHHNSELNYSPSLSGAATSSTWTSDLLEAERASLNPGGAILGDVTYPRYVQTPTGGLTKTYRVGGSGNGDLYLTNYNATTGLWDTPHQVINGSSGHEYTDPVNTSYNRNAYLNGVNYDAQGNIHLTWTWRESAGGSNHDIMYAYSEDNGDTWRNTFGEVVGTTTNPIDLTSPGITVASLDRTNTLMNQQTQTVDADGGVHMVMWHNPDDAPPQFSPPFTTTNAAYYHYYRNPTTGEWSRNELPTSREVGSRPDMAYDTNGNLYVSYVSPGPGDGQGVLDYYTDGDLIVAGASKASGFTDWSILHTDTRDFAGEPSIDQNRLLSDGVLSVFIQENDDVETGRTTTPLHVLEFSPTLALTWAGDDSGVWSVAASHDWDTTGDDVGNAEFIQNSAVRFDDGATQFQIAISGTVQPGSIKFNNPANAYTFTGSGIGGTGGLTVAGGGTVVLANGPNTYAGETSIENGVLELQGAGNLTASQTIRIAEGSTLSVAATNSGGLNLTGQSLAVEGEVLGNVVASAGSLVEGAGRISGNLTTAASIVRVGQTGLPSELVPTTTLIDDFSNGSLASYVETRILDLGSTDNVSFTSVGGVLQTVSTGSDGAEQTVLLRSDHGLAVGQELQIDANIVETSDLDLGLVVAATDSPQELTRSDYATIYLRSSGNQVLTRGFDGESELNLIQNTSPAVKDTLFIARLDDNTFELGFYVGEDRFVLATRTLGNSAIGSAIGFYSDQRESGTIDGFDNLRLVDPNTTAAMGETLTVEGDFSLDSQSTLELDIFSPAVVDQLVVSGVLEAGGVLSILLDVAASAPAAGDVFDILDFGSLTGVFDGAILPELDSGLIWDTSRLAVDGVLQVVAGLTGDFNADGLVDAIDYAMWRNSLGQSGFGLAADADNNFRIDTADFTLWKANYGAVLGPDASTFGSVPEPTSALLAILPVALGGVLSRNRR